MVSLIILDGFGLNEKKGGNAIAQQGTLNLDKLNEFPYTTLEASGEAVGLIFGQMGNSEVGHLNMGAGRVVYQDLPRIFNDIKSGEFFKNAALVKTMQHVKKNNSALHLMGLVSDGGVHSHIDHLKGLVDMAHSFGLEKVFVHVITDGRDTLMNSAKSFVEDLEKHIKGKAKVASITGRVYAMDREKRWERIKLVYDMLVSGVAKHQFDSSIEAIEKNYENKVYDEFIEPTIIGDPALISDNDGFIFFNFRLDRAREITQVLSQKNFTEFERKQIKNLCYCCMTQYSEDFKNVLVAYPPEIIHNNLSSILSKNGLKQFHVSETTKYAHITFYFNGGIEKAYPGEERFLIDSYDVQNFSEVPQMRAPEITESAINAINSRKYDFMIVNLSNPDMIGHTGDLEACKKAIEVVDKCAFEIAQCSLANGDTCIITADHGNAEVMVDENGNAVTSHTTNPVPFWLVSEKYKNVKLNSGKLSNIAPTILKIFGIKPEDNMCDPLF